MDDIKIKKQVVEKIKSSSNILITVSKDPSVDALSAALGLTLALDKIEKYATAIFSGEIPSVMDFLQPEKTFEDNTDSLRDFIIALNKEKADHLRFKPEGDYVRIYITPYKTKITPEDLEFSQGDFNVDLVIALGVDDQGHLDSALDNHGQILHDATVITMTVGDQTSSLGGIDWHDPQSGSLSEMAVGLVESLKDDKTTTLLDASVATALLTGIVAETDRFSNQKTTSASLTIAANLMTLGADQQLIASKLNEPEPEPEPEPVSETKTEEAVADVASEPVGDEQPEPDTGQPEQDILKDGYKIEHEKPSVNAYGLPTEEIAVPETPEPEPAPEPASESLSADTPEVAPASEAESAAVIQPLGVDSSAAETEIDPNSVAQSPLITPSRAYMAGSELSTAYALGDDALTSQQSDEPQGFPGEPSVVPGSAGVNQTPADGGELHGAYAFNDNADNAATQSPPAEAPIDTTQTVSAYAVPVPEPVPEPVSTPTPTPAPVPTPVPEPVTPQELGLPMPPPLPDFQQFNAPASTPAPAIPLPPTQQPEILGDILNEPATPAVSAAPAVSEPSVFTPVTQPPATAQQPYDPAQFQIPGQQSV